MKKSLLLLIFGLCFASYADAYRMNFYAGGGGGTGSNIPYDPLTIDWDSGAFEIRAESFWADITPGGTGAFIMGDGSTYWKLFADDVPQLVVGAAAWTWTTDAMHGGGTGALLQKNDSIASPTYSDRNSLTSGVSFAGVADSVSLVAGGVEGIRVAESAGTVTITFPNGYTRHHDINAGSTTSGPTAPTVTTIGTFRGLGFDADGETVNFIVEVPDDWDGVSDMTLNVIWSPEDGDVIADTEDVDWSALYRSIAEGEAMDNGTAVDATATYLQSGAGTDKEQIITTITIDYDNANQPLTAEDAFGVQFNRDVSGEANSYSGLAIVYRWELEYNATGMPAH